MTHQTRLSVAPRPTLSVALLKQGQRWEFACEATERHVSATCRQMAVYANDPDCNFSWPDATILSFSLREMLRKETQLAVGEAS